MPGAAAPNEVDRACEADSGQGGGGRPHRGWLCVLHEEIRTELTEASGSPDRRQIMGMHPGDRCAGRKDRGPGAMRGLFQGCILLTQSLVRGGGGGLQSWPWPSLGEHGPCQQEGRTKPRIS